MGDANYSNWYVIDESDQISLNCLTLTSGPLPEPRLQSRCSSQSYKAIIIMPGMIIITGFTFSKEA